MGRIANNNNPVAEVARILRMPGAKKNHPEILGYNSRLDLLQTAILRVKLPYLEHRTVS